MEQTGAFWQRLEVRQKSFEQIGDSPATRETSPISVQIPKSGQQVQLERSYLQSGSETEVTVTYISDRAFGAIDAGVLGLGIATALAILYAARRLKAWIEVGLVTTFLVVDVLLDLLSADLARDFLYAGLAVFGILAAYRLVRQLKDFLKRKQWGGELE